MRYRSNGRCHSQGDQTDEQLVAGPGCHLRRCLARPQSTGPWHSPRCAPRDGCGRWSSAYGFGLPHFQREPPFLSSRETIDLTADGTPIFDADSVRPLNVTNADILILANDVRIILEPAVSLHISHMQRGFFHGRSMLANVVGLDTDMAKMALSEPD